MFKRENTVQLEITYKELPDAPEISAHLEK